MSPYFLLSYARRDNVGQAWVTKFYEDLTDAFARTRGISEDVKPEEIGFFDRSSIKGGDDWPQGISAALATCNTLVCLLSPAFINSRYCGQEFQVFSDRLRDLRPIPPLILPVLWYSPKRVRRDLPQAFANIQFIEPKEDKDEDYALEGISALVRQRRHYEFVARLAERLDSVTEKFNLAPSTYVPSLAGVPSAFHPSGNATSSTTQQEEGLGVAQFFFLAGNREELSAIRTTTMCYGLEGGRDWRPFCPPASETIGLISQKAATDQGMFYEHKGLRDDLVDLLREAEANNTTVLLVVDPWSAKLDRYRTPLSEFDKGKFLNCGLMVPWNDHDGETPQNRQDLVMNLKGSLHRTYALNASYVRDNILSSEQLLFEIAAAMAEIRNHLMANGEVFKPVLTSESGATELPFIKGFRGK